MYKTLGFKWLHEQFCPASAFATADSDDARNPQRFIHVPLQASVKTDIDNNKQLKLKTMSIVNGTFSVTCNNCGKQHDFQADEADFDATSGSERQMGPENGYTWEHAFNCGACGN